MNEKPGEDPSVMSAHDLVRALGADVERGLTAHEAARRLAADGTNELHAEPPLPTWRRALQQFNDPLTYPLLAAIFIALAAWLIEGRAGWPVDAIVIAVIVVLNAVLGHVQQAKAENAVAALARMTVATSAVLRGGQLQRVPGAELVRGDLLVLGEGEAVGADARLLQATSLRVQEASLTGESEAVLKDATVLARPAALGDRLNVDFKGTAVAQGSARAVVTAIGMQTEVGRAQRRRCDPRVAVRCGAGGGGRARRFAGDPVGGARARRTAHGEAPCDRQEPVVGRDAGFGLGDLLRKDRYADALGDDDRAGDDRVGWHACHGCRLRPRGARGA
jgi:hypothetical protein